MKEKNKATDRPKLFVENSAINNFFNSVEKMTCLNSLYNHLI